MVIIEKSFPRGGIPAAKEKAAATQKETQIFGAVQKKIKKTKTKSTKKSFEDDDQQNDALESFSAELLNYETIQDGMIIMGIIKKVDQLYVSVSLPGRIIARVSALEISDSYTKITKEFLQNSAQAEGYKPLKDLYRVGQIVYGRVLEVKTNEKGHVLIDMTFKPSEVHAELNHSSIRKGFVFSGAVEEVQEHGYIIESGIKGLRCFLPLEKSKEGHGVGELIYLKVDKMTLDQAASTCICREVSEDKLKVKDQADPSLDYLLPTTIVNFQVGKRLKDGLKGTVMNELFTAYVNEHHLGNALLVPDDYEINEKYEARILYVMPLTKLVYLTLNVHRNNAVKKEENDQDDADTSNDNVEHSLKRGDIIEDAKVHHLGTGGVVLALDDSHKGILSFKTIKSNYKGNYDQDELLAKYAKDTTHKVRILDYDIMDCVYVCTDDTTTVQEKFFALDDFHPGDFVTAKVKEYSDKIGGYIVQVGMASAIIEKLFLAPNFKIFETNTRLKCRIVAVSAERKMVYLTNRQEYLSKSCTVLTSFDEARINGNYTGTIVKSEHGFALVKFFGDVKGIFYRQNAPAGFLDTLKEGQTMQFRVADKKDGQLILGVVENAFKLGEICPATIVHKLDSALEFKVAYAPEGADDGEEGQEIEFKGLIPIRFLSNYPDLLLAKLNMYQIGEQTPAACINKNIFSVRDVQYFTENLTPNWKSINMGDILKAHVKDVNDEVVEVNVPINNYTKSVKLHLNMMLMDINNAAKVSITPYQVIYVKVLGKEDLTKTISVSAKLIDVWDCQLSSTAKALKGYFDELSCIKKSLKKQSNPIARYSVGDKVKAQFQGVIEGSNDWEYVLEKTQLVAIVKSSLVGKAKPPTPGTAQDCIVLWVDYSSNLLFLSNKPGDTDHILPGKEIPQNLIGKGGINAKVLFKNESIFICSLKKGKHPLVYCPAQLHFNDFEKSCSNTVNEGDFCKLNFIDDQLPLAVLDDTHKIWTEISRKRKHENENKEKEKVAAKKAKLEVEKTTERKRKTSESQEEVKKPKKETAKKPKVEQPDVLFYEDKSADKKAAAKVVDIVVTTPKPEDSKKESKTPKVTPKSLAGVSNFWTTDLKDISKTEDSSDEDEDEEGQQNANDAKNKKKLTAAEKFKQQREEEARLRAIEEKYADPTQLPDSVDQFDRLVLSDPNNSKHWINYMVFHLQSAEIDKARAVARRALKTITFRNSEEQINIWVALLNLELRYGSKETFNDTLKEALIYNEPLKIYLRAVEIITDSKKTQELIEMIGIITKKFKAEQEMWRVAANAYFSVGMTERAQQLLHKALACLPERDHVNTIVMFANLNHKHGENEMAQTLLDQVVTSYPKRVDVWSQYVDMLVKAELIDSARNILERAIVQKIPLRKMRTIFKKYLEFEERFGNDANVQRVKQLAMEYVKKNENL
ncbi:protein RRP5 homolog [Musca vetustissima]|uniref:protein RRP5 homolog n=1 Tax=Musca vetustissima TaxID=27455 RepID=UPI002AB635D3|nr:protein RRP5 homolog [Musca vetustissima]